MLRFDADYTFKGKFSELVHFFYQSLLKILCSVLQRFPQNELVPIFHNVPK